MSGKILVAYATKCGSTREIAEFMVKTLQEKGVDADLSEMKTVKSVKDYNGLVLGCTHVYVPDHWRCAHLSKKVQEEY